jgi:hypothetical protein
MSWSSKYIGTFINFRGETITVDFQQEDYAGSSSAIVMSDNPCVISMGNESDDYLQVIRPNTAVMEIVCDQVDQYIDFLSSSDTEWKVVVADTTNEKVLFEGFLVPEQYRQSYSNNYSTLTLRAHDGMEFLKYYPYMASSSTRYIGLESIINVIYNCLTIAGLTIPIREALRTFENSFTQDESLSPLAQAYVYQERFYDEEQQEAWNCYDVLTEVLRPFNAYAQLTGNIAGVWSLYIFEIATLLRDSFNYRLFTDGSPDEDNPYEYLSNHVVMDDIYWIGNDAEKSYANTSIQD